jgi:Family of unknown function (DUF6011)
MSTALDAQQVAELAVWLGEQTWSEFAQNLARYYRRNRTLTEAQLRSAVSMREKARQREVQRNLANALPKPEIGFYWQADLNTMWFVRPARNGGNPYANTKAPLDARWTYQRGGMVTLANRIHNGQAVALTLAQAKELGHQFGHCVMCGALLNDPVSVENGIGPVCARKLA